MFEMKERNIRVPVVDESRHFIIGYEDLNKDEAKFLLAYMVASQEIQKEIRVLLGM